MLLSSTIIFATVANVIRTNYLIPHEKDRIYVISTVVGAIANLIFNLVFIKWLGSIGACIGTIAAEFSVMFYQIIATRKEVDYRRILRFVISLILKITIVSTACWLIMRPVLIQGIPRILLFFILFSSLYLIINIKLIKKFKVMNKE